MPTEQSHGSGFSSEVQSSSCVKLTTEANWDSIQDYKIQKIQQNCQEWKEGKNRATMRKKSNQQKRSRNVTGDRLTR